MDLAALDAAVFSSMGDAVDIGSFGGDEFGCLLQRGVQPVGQYAEELDGETIVTWLRAEADMIAGSAFTVGAASFVVHRIISDDGSMVVAAVIEQ